MTTKPASTRQAVRRMLSILHPHAIGEREAVILMDMLMGDEPKQVKRKASTGKEEK